MGRKAEVLYLGHASFRLRTSSDTVVYIDPYAGTDYAQAADAVFCSHEHRDHSSVELVTLKPQGKIWRQEELYADGVYADVQLKDIHIRAVPAYNEKHPRETTVGFLVEMNGKKLYIAGDTSKIPEMKALSMERIDYAFFPTDGVFNMDAREASECAGIVGAAHSIPIHTCKNTEGIYNEGNAKRFQADGRILLRPGESLSW